MTKIIVQNISPRTGDTTDFKDIVSSNGAPQWADSYGVIKTNKNLINEDVTIPSGTNGYTAGTVTVGAGKTVTILGEWRIV